MADTKAPEDHTCLNCVHWNKEGYRENVQWGACTKAEGERGGTLDHETLAFARDYEEWHADLITRQDFSCVMYKPNAYLEAAEARKAAM